MQEDIKHKDKEGLWNISKININKFDTIESKAGKFIEDTEGNITAHINGEYIVRNYFTGGDYSATEALIHYIKKIAEINY